MHLVDVGLIGDAATLTALCAEVSSDGGLLVCNGCWDIEAPIAGVLVINDIPLSGSFSMQVPHSGHASSSSGRVSRTGLTDGYAKPTLAGGSYVPELNAARPESYCALVVRLPSASA